VGTNAAFDAAHSNLEADLARRGISGSSVDAGTTGALEGARATDISNAQNNLAMQKVGSEQSRLAALTDLYGNVAQRYNTQGNQGRAAQGQLTGDIAGIYQNLNASGNAEANLENSQTNSALSGAAGAIGQYYGRNTGGGNDDSDLGGNPMGYTTEDARRMQEARNNEVFGPPSPGRGIDLGGETNGGNFNGNGNSPYTIPGVPSWYKSLYKNPGLLYNIGGMKL